MTRSELSHMIDLASRLLAAREPGVLSTLLASNGSTYRRLGSMMVSGPPTLLEGGVSGGCLEAYVARVGRSLTQERPAAMLGFDADPDQDDGAKPVLGCGGSIQVLVERLTELHLSFLKAYRDALVADDASLYACTVNLTDLDRPIISRGWFSNADKADDRWSIVAERAATSRQTQQAMLPDGRRTLVQYLPPMTRLVIFGAGDDVRPLCTTAHGLGWHVTIADRRARLVTSSRFPEADELLSEDWQPAVEQIRFTPRTAVVLMTHSLPDDIEILPLLQDKPMFYAGSLGPPHRRQWLIDGAADLMTLDEAFAASFRGPIGLNLGDRSATGIVVSITAEILAELHHRDPTPLSVVAERLPSNCLVVTLK